MLLMITICLSIYLSTNLHGLSAHLSIYLSICMSCSDKPNPKQYEVNAVYNFENWAALIVQFIEKEVKRPCVLVCNSVGR